eukprot:g394.t1
MSGTILFLSQFAVSVLIVSEWQDGLTMILRVVVIVSGGLGLFVGLLVSSLCGFHVYLLFTGLGTYDWLIHRAQKIKRIKREKRDRQRDKRTHRDDDEDEDDGIVLKDEGIELGNLAPRRNQTVPLPVPKAKDPTTLKKIESLEKNASDRSNGHSACGDADKEDEGKAVRVTIQIDEKRRVPDDDDGGKASTTAKGAEGEYRHVEV